MAEKGTEQATPQRKRKAIERGDRVRSRECISAASLLGGIVALGASAQSLIQHWCVAYTKSVQAMGNPWNTEQWNDLFRTILLPALVPLAFVIFASFISALFVGIAQGGGVSIVPTALQPRFDRLNPASNIAVMFSLRSVTRLLKSLLPACIILAIGWANLKSMFTSMPAMSLNRLPVMFSSAWSIVLKAALVAALWSALDFAVEWRSWNQRLKMSKQEIREELKETMGNPQIKGKIRQIQRAMRRRKVKADISRASVVITNPTHYAVALEFSFETMQAPTVLAKGRDLHAAEIREEARWAGIPIIENPPLARSLYKLVELGHPIPFELYSAVAGILAYLYRQKVDERDKSSRSVRQEPMRYGLQGMYGFGGGM